MQVKRFVIAVAVAAALATSASALDAPIEAKGSIESVILYRGQALVTRVVPFEAPAGTVELVVRDLPEQILGDSLYAGAQDGTQVRAVRYRTRAVGEAPHEEVRRLDEEIEGVEKEIRKKQDLQQTLAGRMAYLGKLENFIAPTAQVEMSKGVLNAKTLKELTLFMFEERGDQADALFELKEEQKELQKELDLLRRHRAKLTRGSSRTEREALIFLEKADAGPARVRLSYLVGNASWSPAYNLRASGKLENVEIEYNALVRQISGEDWNGVALTLSTASPMMTADAPALAPLLISLQRPGKGRQAQPADEQMLRGQFSAVQRKFREAQKSLQYNPDRYTQIDRNWKLNMVSNSAQGLELMVSGRNTRALQELQRAESSGLSVNYKLPGGTSVASRSDRQIVRIADLTLPTTFSNVAIPLLTEQVHRQAEIANNSETALLEGPSSVYLDGDFVGKGTLPVVARGQKFVVGFGTDPQLRGWREFVSRTETIQGGNREVTLKYRLVLDNYKDQPADMRVLDRLPCAKADIRVTLGDMEDAISDDVEYLRAWRPTGILRWDIEVPAHSAAATARIIEYSFKMEYDRNMQIDVVSEERMQTEMRAKFERQMLAN